MNWLRWLLIRLLLGSRSYCIDIRRRQRMVHIFHEMELVQDEDQTDGLRLFLAVTNEETDPVIIEVRLRALAMLAHRAQRRPRDRARTN